MLTRSVILKSSKDRLPASASHARRGVSEGSPGGSVAYANQLLLKKPNRRGSAGPATRDESLPRKTRS